MVTVRTTLNKYLLHTGRVKGSDLPFAIEWGVVRDVWGECYECRRHVW